MLSQNDKGTNNPIKLANKMKKLCTKKGKPKSQQTLKEKDTEIH